MTVIAWDGHTLAADSQTQRGDLITSKTTEKIFLCTEGHTINNQQVLAFGIAGDVGAHVELYARLAQGLNFDTTFNPASEIYAILVTASRAFELYKREGSANCTISPASCPTAMGSGGAVAEVAMRLGYTAPEAVEQAIAMITSCGGTVTIWNR